MFFLQITYGLSTNCYGICGMVRYILSCQMGNIVKELCIVIQFETVPSCALLLTFAYLLVLWMASRTPRKHEEPIYALHSMQK